MRTVTRLGAGADQLIPLFEAIRADAGVDVSTPDEARREALDSATELDPPHVADGRSDATDLPFVTVDPPGSRDLDQAVHIERMRAGHRVRYAIADVGAHVVPGGALDRLAHARGVTIYCPDTRVSLHPREMSEAHASLLPGQRTKAVVWTFDVLADGSIGGVALERAWVRSRRQYAYRELASSTDAESRDLVARLAEVGQARRRMVRSQGGVTLPKPSQEVVPVGDRFVLRLEAGRPLEDDNAQVSLATGMVGASLMIAGGAGVLRTMPAADAGAVTRLRAQAGALGVRWRKGQDYSDVLESLDHGAPETAAFLDAATVLFRGADWSAFDLAHDGAALPDPVTHGALGAPYSHVTAPLRRLVDRYAAEAALASARGREVPAWARAGLAAAADDTAAGSRRAGDVERRCVHAVESAVLRTRVGETFEGVGLDDRTVQLVDPPVVARCEGDVQPGVLQRVRLVSAAPPDPPRFVTD
ncbi:RNB domain-containing ribonuclease [Demequina muriae]|uniref:RNB domain-containing ribonuclease n=1 Tax=Demequina muriae TaxID=3051664 RepID=A0ABT8GK41_9MICO|nr:RNB domain-containing ribonuclease [Demequina sp. EGI L300058]MDN4481734.1 RNB domain-containing ribonuclease [Demequina sp. EGI L300058]